MSPPLAFSAGGEFIICVASRLLCRSRSHTHRRRRYRRSESESSAWRSSSTDSRHLRRSAERTQSESPFRQPGLRENGHGSMNQMGFEWRPVIKSTCTTPPNYRSAPPNGSIVQSGSGGDIFTKKGFPHDILSNQNKGRQDYDSGNDTSSPPSTKTNSSRSKVNEDKKGLSVEFHSPEKLRFTDGDNASDSGNSVTSYSSLCKPLPLENGSANILNGNTQSVRWLRHGDEEAEAGDFGGPERESAPRPLQDVLAEQQPEPEPEPQWILQELRRLPPLLSQPVALLQEKVLLPIVQLSDQIEKQEENGERKLPPEFQSRDQEREHKKYSSSEKESKRGKERRRRRSYSPMRKRRRDSPSHLEARRITSARKRPIPYYRPSPSSSSRSTSCSSWESLFTRSRSRTRSRSGSRSRSRSFSSYRSYSRGSWTSLSGRSRSRSCSRSRSRSRSYGSVGSYGRARR
ncbi:hypothetical protein JZ751_023516 [Albula glossodonta]|uniref:Serine/arginine repetitive matrix protein C-terminal domain-containing protein n=1 Tax=Albula glossodonta TaxID=121402 RepID=A0A8T2NGV5_9TELE|nr:hypothetical protein JZ751_023516 [Albula glossodonta]